MKTPQIITLFLAFCLATSCAFHHGTFDSGVAITNNQFRIVGIASGKAQTTHFLGIGGLTKDALVYEAKRDLYSKYPLTKGMAFTNISVDFKRSYYCIVNRTKVFISADIIDFNPEHFDLKLQGFYTNDSTFFPTDILPKNYLPSYTIDRTGNYIKAGYKVKFMLNGALTEATVRELTRYGLKCEYQTANGTKKIYLNPKYVSIVE